MTDRAVPTVTARQLLVLAVITAVLSAGVLVLLFGPARGARNDLASLRTDLAGSRQSINGTLGTGREALAGVRRRRAGPISTA